MSESTTNNVGIGPYDLSVTPIHLDAEGPAVPLSNFGFDGSAFEAYIRKHCAQDPARIVMVEISPSNWKHWERHTLGDEIVIVLEGKADFIQQASGEDVLLSAQAGSAIINPKGVWHSANVSEPLKAIYITPCKGTEHRER